jgi:hypothetical protein
MIDKLNFQGRHPDEEHEVEVNRIHAALHPECFARLAAASRLASPDDRLELPHFFLAADDADHDSSRTPPNLSPDELSSINELLVQEAMRRKSVSAGFLRVLVDGIQRAEIHIGHPQAVQFLVDEDAELIEAYSLDQQGALLLATHLLNFNGADKQNFTITVEGGQRIEFTVGLLRDANGATTGARVGVAFKDTAPAHAASRAARRLWGSMVPAAALSGWWKPASALAVLALLVTGTWWVWTNRQNRNRVVTVTPAPAPTVRTVAPAPDQPGDKEQPRPSEPRPKKSPDRNEIAPPVMAQREPRPRERDESFVERSLLPNSANAESGEVATRGVWNRDVMGKPLTEIHQVLIQTVGDATQSEGLAKELQARLAGGLSLRLSDAERADAALKISVRPASARAGDSRVVVVVRAVNANGYVVWPASRRGSTWRYVGRPQFVAERIVTDLTKDIRAAKR